MVCMYGMYVCMYVMYVCMYACMYVCMYNYIYIETTICILERERVTSNIELGKIQ